MEEKQNHDNEPQSPEAPSELKDQLENLWDLTKGALQKSGEEFKKVSKIGKLKLDSSALQRERYRKLTELGELVIQLMRENKIANSELAERVESIDAICEKIEDQEKEIRALSDS